MHRQLKMNSIIHYSKDYANIMDRSHFKRVGVDIYVLRPKDTSSFACRRTYVIHVTLGV